MPKLPEPDERFDTLKAIDAAIVEDAESGFRAHLGGSMIGRECDRALWYSFRWTNPAHFPARVLRMFRRGQREEDVLIRDLRRAGVFVLARDPDTRKQYTVAAHGGHFGGSLDGIGRGFREALKAWHVIEFKTHNAKSFAALKKGGVAKSKPEHHAQCQVYMRLMKLDRAYYLAVNKDTDDYYAERIRLDKREADRLIERAGRIIFAEEPPARISDDPAWFACKFCDYHAQCHGGMLPENVSCRNCLHSTPKPVPDPRGGPGGAWHCARWDAAIPFDAQLAGCEEHLVMPALVPAEVVHGDSEQNTVLYRLPDGREFVNGKREGRAGSVYNPVPAYPSHELCAAGTEFLANAQIEQIRESFQANLIANKDAKKSPHERWKATESEPFNDEIPW